MRSWQKVLAAGGVWSLGVVLVVMALQLTSHDQAALVVWGVGVAGAVAGVAAAAVVGRRSRRR